MISIRRVILGLLVTAIVLIAAWPHDLRSRALVGPPRGSQELLPHEASPSTLSEHLVSETQLICMEDEACWDWRTMGNKRRGVCAAGHWMTQHADGTITDDHPTKARCSGQTTE